MAAITCRRRSTRGNAALEFAISFAVLWALFAGVLQFGYLMFIYNSLNQAVAAGAHFAARVDFDSPDHAFVTQVRNMVVYGSPDGGASPLAPGLATDNVSVTWSLDAAGYPQTITVGIVGYEADAIFQTLTLDTKPRMTVRFLGSYKTPG